MDAFEQVVGEILWIEGYWVRTSFKVELTKEEKILIGRPSSPRRELDVLGYNARDNLLRVVECKSFLDSQGVRLSGFVGEPTKGKSRYKLFNDPHLRQVVFGRLVTQLSARGAGRPDTCVKFSLAAGNIHRSDREELRRHFADQDWELWDQDWLRQRLLAMSQLGYENQVSAVVAKLIFRNAIEVDAEPS